MNRDRDHTSNFDGDFSSSGGTQAVGSTFNSNGGDINFGSGHNTTQCLHDLLLTNPRLDKERIEANYDRILEGSCSWVVEDPAFVDWWLNDVPNVLWVRGDAGMGKTMMTIALISEISQRLSCLKSGTLAYFFCQSTSPDLNSAVAVLRGLIYQLLLQEKSLLHILQKPHMDAGKRLFEDRNALFAMFEILKQIIEESIQSRVYLMIDALDECDFELDKLLRLIFQSGMSSKVKWFMTSRNEVYIMHRSNNIGNLVRELHMPNFARFPSSDGRDSVQESLIPPCFAQAQNSTVALPKSLLKALGNRFTSQQISEFMNVNTHKRVTRTASKYLPSFVYSGIFPALIYADLKSKTADRDYPRTLKSTAESMTPGLLRGYSMFNIDPTIAETLTPTIWPSNSSLDVVRGMVVFGLSERDRRKRQGVTCDLQQVTKAVVRIELSTGALIDQEVFVYVWNGSRAHLRPLEARWSHAEILKEEWYKEAVAEVENEEDSVSVSSGKC